MSFRCDVHGWMRAYANVVTHPFFAVTKDDGSFEIKGLPAGTYTIEAWHERLGHAADQGHDLGQRRRRDGGVQLQTGSLIGRLKAEGPWPKGWSRNKAWP